MRFKQITVLVLTMVLSLIFSPDNGLAGAWTFDKGKSYHRCELNVYETATRQIWPATVIFGTST